MTASDDDQVFHVILLSEAIITDLFSLPYGDTGSNFAAGQSIRYLTLLIMRMTYTGVELTQIAVHHYNEGLN